MIHFLGLSPNSNPGGVTSDEQGLAQETQNLGSHQTPIQEALGISWRKTKKKLIFINHQSFIT